MNVFLWSLSIVLAYVVTEARKQLRNTDYVSPANLAPVFQEPTPKKLILIDDEFDKLSASFNEDNEGESETPEFETLVEVVEHYWKNFYPGSIPTQVMIIAEAAYPQGRVLRHFSEATEWATLGMMECVKMQIQAANVDEALGGFSVSLDDDEEEEDDE